MNLLRFLFKKRVLLLCLGLLLGWLCAAPAVLLQGRIWAEEGLDFFAYAIAHRPWGGLSYAHKQHLDLLPNIAASFAAQGWFKPGFWFVSISLLPYGFLVAAAARLLKATPLSACFVVGLVWALNPSGWEGLLNSINSWSVLAAAYLLLIARPPSARCLFIASLLPAVSFPALLFMPLALLRRSWIQFGGLAIGGLVQVMVFLFGNGDLAGTGITDNRIIQLLDITALPAAIVSRSFLHPLFASPILFNWLFLLSIPIFCLYAWILQQVCCYLELDNWFAPQWLAWQGFALLFSLGGAHLVASEPFGHQRYGVVSVLILPVLLVLLLDKINYRPRAWIWILIIWSLLLFPIFNGLKMVRVMKQSKSSDLACMHWPATGVSQICPRGWAPVQGSLRLLP
jgi:hypothetical protein